MTVVDGDSQADIRDAQRSLWPKVASMNPEELNVIERADDVLQVPLNKLIILISARRSVKRSHR